MATLRDIMAFGVPNTSFGYGCVVLFVCLLWVVFIGWEAGTGYFEGRISIAELKTWWFWSCCWTSSWLSYFIDIAASFFGLATWPFWLGLQAWVDVFCRFSTQSTPYSKLFNICPTSNASWYSMIFRHSGIPKVLLLFALLPKMLLPQLLRTARNPPGLLSVKLTEMEQGRFVARGGPPSMSWAKSP